MFDAEDVESLVVGAYAMAAHGFPRATGDLDLCIRPDTPNADRVMQALKTFGALSLKSIEMTSPTQRSSSKLVSLPGASIF